MSQVDIHSEIPEEHPGKRTGRQVRPSFSGLSRIPFVEPCRLEGGTGARYVTIRDLSAVGAYIALEPVPEIGEGFVISFSLPGRAVPLTVDSVVTWRNTVQDHKVPDLPPGCGLRFLALSPKDLQRIHALVKGYATVFPLLPRVCEP